YRWHVVFARAYDQQAPARFATLAKQAETAPVTAPIGRARTVIVEQQTGDAAPDHVVVDVASDGVPLRPTSPDTPTLRFAAPGVPVATSSERTRPGTPRAITAELSTPALARHLDETEALRKDAERRLALDSVRGRNTLHGFVAPQSSGPIPIITESVPPP